MNLIHITIICMREIILEALEIKKVYEKPK
jgi:hypothetical protein